MTGAFGRLEDGVFWKQLTTNFKSFGLKAELFPYWNYTLRRRMGILEPCLGRQTLPSPLRGPNTRKAIKIKSVLHIEAVGLFSALLFSIIVSILLLVQLCTLYN